MKLKKLDLNAMMEVRIFINIYIHMTVRLICFFMLHQ